MTIILFLVTTSSWVAILAIMANLVAIMEFRSYTSIPLKYTPNPKTTKIKK